MKKQLYFVVSAILMAFALAGCGSKSAEEKIQAQIKDKVHALTADERPRAVANAKSYFEKEFPVIVNGQRGTDRGVFLECRPSDSNFNGLVTCKGQVPQLQGGFREVTRYCGYTPELVGCSDEDTVK
jgi:hypothetical protein